MQFLLRKDNSQLGQVEYYNFLLFSKVLCTTYEIFMKGRFVFILKVTAQKIKFSITDFFIHVTKPAVSCGFVHTYWRNPLWKTLFFVQWAGWVNTYRNSRSQMFFKIDVLKGKQKVFSCFPENFLRTNFFTEHLVVTALHMHLKVH